MKSLRLCFYSAVLFLLQPLVLLYLLWRARKQPEYAKNWSERFAFYTQKKVSISSKRVWIHAVSLGETRAALPLVEALFAEQPEAHVILTHTTPTGRAAGQTLFAEALSNGRMTQVYVPYDLYGAVARFFRTFAPTDVWVMETEVWPNMVAAANRRGIPISLVNGRLSEKSMRQALKLPRLMGDAYCGFKMICAQTESDAFRYRQLGVNDAQLVVTGNLKFDMKAPAAQIQMGEQLKRLISDRPVVLLASTREGEETQWLEALKREVAVFPKNTQWWIVPRHPQRFDDVAQLLQDNFETTLLRKSELDALSLEKEKVERLQASSLVLGDTMGEMFAYYALADVVMMGGAWGEFGGQNFLEPLSIGKPTVIGKHTHNFAQAAADADAAGALSVADSMMQGLTLAALLLNDRERYMNQQANARQFCLAHQGAVAKSLAVLL